MTMVKSKALIFDKMLRDELSRSFYEEDGMNSRLKKYAGALAIIVGVLLTWEAASEANTMFMIESICLAVIGMCYVLPVRDVIKHLISEAEKAKEKQKQPETEMFLIR